MKKKVLSVFLVLAMVLSVLPMSVFAAENESITYIDRSWDGEKIVETEKECEEEYIVVDENTTTLEGGKWYVVNADVTVADTIEVKGTANLILCDDCTLTMAKNTYIELAKGNTLNIYGQANDSGALVVSRPGEYHPAIGTSKSYSTAGTLNVYGGDITANGGYASAGIGGTQSVHGGTLTVYGGKVTATGHRGESDLESAAGIGGGRNGNGGTVTIYGGTVNAICAGDGAGIGSGQARNGETTYGGTVTVYGGILNATGGTYYGTGIGGSMGGHGANVYIYGGDVTATGGALAASFGAGYGIVNDGTLTLGDTMVLKAGHETADTKMTPDEYYQVGYRYAHVYDDTIAKGQNWFINGDGVLYITGEVQNTSTTTDYTPWKDYKSQITAVVAKDGAKITNCDRLFSNCENLTSVDIAKLDITGTTSMRYMFSGCSSLESLDLSTLDTSAVTTMQCMFYNASGLKSINVSGWNTSNVNDMQYMFRNCASLTSLDLSSFNTAKVTTFYTTFYQCSKLETLDISNFSSDSLTRTDYVFDSCPLLGEIAVNGNALQKLASPISALSSAWYNKDNGTEYKSAAQLQTVEGKVVLTKTKPLTYVERSWDGKKVVETVKVIEDFIVLDEDIRKLEDGKWYVVTGDVTHDSSIPVWGTANLILCDGSSLTINGSIYVQTDRTLNIYGQSVGDGVLSTNAATSDPGIGGSDCGTINIHGGTINATGGKYGAGIGGKSYSRGGNVTVYGGNVTAIGGENAAGIGGGYQGNGRHVTVYGGNVTAIGGNVTIFAASGNGKGIGAGFFGASSSTMVNGALTLGNKMTLKAGHEAADTKMTPEEYYQVGYRYAHVYDDTIANGENWYITCDGVLYIIGPVENTSSAGSDNAPWKDYKSQITAVVAMDGAAVTNCDCLFSDCENLKSVDIAKLDITGTTSMRYMFSGCPSLESLDLSTLDTSAVTSMMCMFYNASGLKSINVSGWNTSNVNDMQYMFNNCASLTELDLGSFDTSKVTTVYTMFYKCSNLEKLNIGNFSGDKLTSTDFVLSSCPALAEITVNGNALQKLAEPIISAGVVPVWYNNVTTEKYQTTDDLKAIEGKVTLVKSVPFLFDSVSLVLSGELGLNFYTVINDVEAVKDGYMLFEIGNKVETQAVYFTDAVLVDGRYVFRCNVNALQMADAITVSFHYGDVTVGPKTTSVASYIDKLIAKHNNDDTDPTVKLAKSILNYGHYAQLALAETRNIKLGEDYAVTDNLSYVTIANASDLEAYKATKTGSIDGITKVSRSLSLDHGTDINLYLTVKDEYVPNVTVADKNGNAVDFTLEKTGSRYMLVIPQIAAHQLGDTYTVSVDDGAMTVKVSALSYAYSVLSSEKTDAQKLCVSALYEYYTAAITYRNAQ